MVVPSEKNSEILDLKMIESSEFKDSALNNSNSDHPIVPPSPDRTFERDKSEKEPTEKDDNVEQPPPQPIIDNAAAGNQDNSLAIEDSPTTQQQFTKSDSVQSLQESDNIDLKVLEESSSSSRSSAEDEEEGSASLQLLAEQRNLSSIEDSKPCLDSTYLEST